MWTLKSHNQELFNTSLIALISFILHVHYTLKLQLHCWELSCWGTSRGCHLHLLTLWTCTLAFVTACCTLLPLSHSLKLMKNRYLTVLLRRHQHVAMDLLLYCFYPRPSVFWGWDLWNQTSGDALSLLPYCCFPSSSSFLCFLETRSHTVAQANVEVPVIFQPKLGITGVQLPHGQESYRFSLWLCL